MMVLVALVLLALFLLVLWLNRRTAPRFPTLDLQAPSAEQLRSRLTRKLEGGELQLAAGGQDGCRREGNLLAVPEGITCVFSIPANPDRTRQARLALSGAGQSVGVELGQENALTVEETLERGQDPLELDVFRNADDQPAVLTFQDCAVVRPTDTPEDEELYCEVNLLR